VNIPEPFELVEYEGQSVIKVTWGNVIFTLRPDGVVDQAAVDEAVRRVKQRVGEWLADNLDGPEAHYYLRRLKDRFDPRVQEIRQVLTDGDKRKISGLQQ